MEIYYVILGSARPAGGELEKNYLYEFTLIL